jgi:hypothetical protein
MIVQSKSFDRSLAENGICIQRWDNIAIKISNRLICFHGGHGAHITSKAYLHIRGDVTGFDWLLHLVCKLPGIELIKIEPCFDIQKQVEAELNFIPRAHRKRRRCREDDTRQLFLAIFH